MCITCFLTTIAIKCDTKNITELNIASNSIITAKTSSLLDVPFTQTIPGDVCSGTIFDNKQSTRAEFQKEAKKIINIAISKKKAALRNEVMAAMPDAGIGQRFMNDANKDERDLDRICRLLQAGPLKNEVCVAACWTPYQWDLGAPSIVFSTNKCQGELGATDKEIKKKILTFFSNYNPPAQEEKYSALEKASLKNKHHNRPPAAYSADMQVFLNARDHAKLNRDNSRAATAIKNGKFFVVKTQSNDVHAELRILEYIHWYSCENGLLTKEKPIPLYIGVSLLCCSKCVAFFFLYRKCSERLLLPSSRGQHGIMDSNWQAPPLLTALIQNGTLIEKIVLSSLPPSDLAPGVGKHMTEDLSDSDSDGY